MRDGRFAGCVDRSWRSGCWASRRSTRDVRGRKQDGGSAIGDRTPGRRVPADPGAAADRRRDATSRRSLPGWPSGSASGPGRRVDPDASARRGSLPSRSRPGRPSTSSWPPTRSSSRTWPTAGSSIPDRSGPMPEGRSSLASTRPSGDSVRRPGRPDEARGQEDRPGQPRVSPLTARPASRPSRSAGLWAEVSSRRSSRPSRSGRPCTYVQNGRRRGRAGRPSRSPTCPRSGSVEVDPALYDPIIQGLGIVAASGRSRRVPSEFAAFVLGAEGQAILANSDFQPPTAGPDRDALPQRSNRRVAENPTSWLTSPRSGSRFGLRRGDAV